MPINYWKDGGDLGTALSDAIEPVENGEPVEKSYINRPSWNLQNRSEVVRQSFDELQSLVLANCGMTLATSDSAKMIFYEGTPSNTFKIRVNYTGSSSDESDADLYLLPIVSGARHPSGGSNEDVPAKFVKLFDSGGSLTLEVAPRVSAGAHNVMVRMFYEAGVNPTNPVISIEGAANPLDPLAEVATRPIIIAIQIRSDGLTDATAVRDRILLSAPASDLVTPAATAGAIISTDCFDPLRPYEGDVGSTAGLDAEGVKIPAAVLEEFFIDEDHSLEEGSTLVALFASGAQRRQQTTDSAFTVNNLAILKPGEAFPNVGLYDTVIPIAKVFWRMLFLVNGKVLIADVYDYVQLGQQHHNVFMDNLYVNVGGNLSISGTFSSHLIPDAAAYDLGSSGTHWRTLYVNSIVGGTGSSSFDTLTVNHELNVGDADSITGTIFKGPFEHRTNAGVKNFHVDPTNSFNVGVGGAANATHKFAVTGTSRFSGHMGIGGDSDPTYTLFVTGATKLYGDLRCTDVAGTANYLYVQESDGHVGIGYTPDASYHLYVQGGIKTWGGLLCTNSGASANYLKIDGPSGNEGHVGINTTPTSAAQLTIDGAIRMECTAPWIKFRDSDHTVPTDEKVWVLDAQDGNFGIYMQRDTEAANLNALVLERNGVIITAIKAGGSFIPDDTTGALDLGTSTNYWGELHVKDVFFHADSHVAGGGLGVGSIKMTSGNNADNAGFIKVNVGTDDYYIPVFATNNP